MKICALCGMDTEDGELARISEVDLCSSCRESDPTEKLARLDIAAEWDTRLMRFSAGLGIAHQDPSFRLECKPELWYHEVQKLVSKDFEVGDASFDDAIWVQTNDPEIASEILGNVGARSAILALLTRVRVNELARTHVTLEGPTLLVSARPLGGLPPEKIQELKLETAALALHLRLAGVSRGGSGR